MIVDTDVLQRAGKGNRAAMVEVLSAQYPASYRMAYGICGREDVGNGIVRYVMKQSFRVAKHWNDDEAPQRWFRHHTLLTTRRAARWKPDPATDTLIAGAGTIDAAYPAFIRALRALTHQQMEAFLLTHGERLDLRGLAVAMDCSTTAAQMHLHEAENRLRQLAGNEYDTCLRTLEQQYQNLTPSKDLAIGRVQTGLSRYHWPKRILRMLRLLLLLAVLAALIWLAWRLRNDIISAIRALLGQ